MVRIKKIYKEEGRWMRSWKNKVWVVRVMRIEKVMILWHLMNTIYNNLMIIRNNKIWKLAMNQDKKVIININKKWMKNRKYIKINKILIRGINMKMQINFKMMIYKLLKRFLKNFLIILHTLWFVHMFWQHYNRL